LQGEVFVEARICKDPAEIEKIRTAAAIADAAFMQAPHLLKPGRTENEVAAELEYNMKKKGSEKVAFDTIVASGPRSWFPHALLRSAASKKVTSSPSIWARPRTGTGLTPPVPTSWVRK